jgi:hypothetical protein
MGTTDQRQFAPASVPSAARSMETIGTQRSSSALVAPFVLPRSLVCTPLALCRFGTGQYANGFSWSSLCPAVFLNENPPPCEAGSRYDP